MTASRRRLRAWPLAGLAVVLALVLVAAPGLIAHGDPTATTDSILQGPSPQHWFGTDQLGRDVFGRVLHGARPVLVASFLGVALATLAGVTLGLLGGFAPKFVSSLVMRVVDVLLALPVLLIALLVMSTLNTGVVSIAIAICIAFTPGYARVVNSSVRRLRTAEYVQASRVFGTSGTRTALRHLVPNLATEVVVLVSSGIGWAVLTATTLSFLGLGVQLPAADWGSDLAAGAPFLATAWWLSTFPGLAITVTILLANFVGDYLAAVLDPRGGARFRPATLALPGLAAARRRAAGPVRPPAEPAATGRKEQA